MESPSKMLFPNHKHFMDKLVLLTAWKASRIREAQVKSLLSCISFQTWMNARLMTVECRVSAPTPWEVSDATVIQDLRKMTDMSALISTNVVPIITLVTPLNTVFAST